MLAPSTSERRWAEAQARANCRGRHSVAWPTAQVKEWKIEFMNKQTIKGLCPDPLCSALP